MKSNNRHAICICCGCKTNRASYAVLSSFISYRALKSEPRATLLYECSDCGYKWSQRGLDDFEMMNLYSGYRGFEYFQERHSYEPWYTKALNDGIGADTEMAKRRATLLQVLSSCGVDINDQSEIVDHGGDRGQMLHDFASPIKMVYEVSGVELDKNILRLGSLNEGINRFDLALSCHVLEHVNDPHLLMREVVSLVKRNGYVYLELPRENWKGPWQPKFEIKIIKWIVGSAFFLKCADFVCTAFRTKFRWIPPLGFVLIREHLQFFNLRSMRALMQRCDLKVVYLEEHGDYLIALGRKY